MREVQETSETLDVSALAGVAVEASGRAGDTPPKHLTSKPAAGSALQGEANFDCTASGGCETGGTRDDRISPDHAEPGEQAWSQGARDNDVPWRPTNSSRG